MAEHIQNVLLKTYYVAFFPLRWLYGPLLRRIPATIRHYRLYRRLAAATLSLLLLAILSTIIFLLPRSTVYSYATGSCFRSPTLLPSLTSPISSRSFGAVATHDIKVGGYPIFSERTCINLRQAPKQQAETVVVRSRLMPFMSKRIHVQPGPLAQVSRTVEATRPVSVRDPFMLRLSSPDQSFSYRLFSGKVSAACTVKDQDLSCDTASMKLAQSTSYEFELRRLFKGATAGIAFKQKLKTVDAVTVTTSSIAPGQVVFDKPTEMTITLNRPAASVDAVKLIRRSGDKPQELPITSQLKDDKLTVRFSEPLPRSADLQLTVGSIVAADSGYLATPYILDFKTSGGPKVTSINIGSYAVAATPNIILRFDSAIGSQNLAEVVRLEAGGKVVAATVTGGGTSISIRPQQPFGACTTFVIKVLESLQNSSGVAGGNAWQFQSRTTCQTVFGIGTSVQGRSITAYRFGSGASHVLFVGATHGDERSSATLLNRWVDYLEANPGVIPAHRSITIIPVVNPDGYAASKRTNANNVDLNRNFPANNWKQSVTMPDKSTNPNGGGSSALSEPESKALASYTQSLNPRLVLTYHSTGNVAVPNLSGDSNDLAWKYARNSSVYYLNPSSTATFFEYDTTGAYEDWLHDKPGITALLIELNTHTGNEFSGHLPALKIMAGL